GRALHGSDRARGPVRRAARHRARAAGGVLRRRGLSPRLRRAEPGPALCPRRGTAQDRGDPGIQGASGRGGAVMAARSESGFDLTRPSPEAFENLATDLTPEESDVLLRHGTEAPFCGVFLDEERSGVFTCRLCGLPLFLGGQKFDSGSGWPSFT